MRATCIVGQIIIFFLLLNAGAASSVPTASRIPTARCLMTAERALLDLATSLYPIQTYQSRLSTSNTNTNTEKASIACENNVSVLRNTGWTIADKARGVSQTAVSDVTTTAIPLFTNNSSNIAFAITPTHPTSNYNNNTTSITPITPKRSATPLKSPLHSASSSNLRISTESPMKPSSDGYISPTPKSTRSGVTSPTASSARQSVVPSVSQKTSQVSHCSILSNLSCLQSMAWHYESSPTVL